MSQFEAILLVGHGGIPADAPPELVAELKQLEGARQRRGDTQMSVRETELDNAVRQWPRTRETDPYKYGLEAVAKKLASRIGERRLVVAYNEFCAPSVDDAIASLAREGASKITLATTMFTPGGSHSENEIPTIVHQARRAHPSVEIEYAWPFDLDAVADFLSAHIVRSSS